MLQNNTNIFSREQLRATLTARLLELRARRDGRFTSPAIAARIGAKVGTVNNLLNNNSVGGDLLLKIAADLGLKFEQNKKVLDGEVVTTFALVGVIERVKPTDEEE